MQQDGENFNKFKRENIHMWGQISMLISQLEKWLGQYIVKYAQISSKQLHKYAGEDMDRYSEEDMLCCVINQRQVVGVIKNPKKMFKGPGGPRMAAVMI
jgi:hypothetical protein